MDENHYLLSVATTRCHSCTVGWANYDEVIGFGIYQLVLFLGCMLHDYFSLMKMHKTGPAQSEIKWAKLKKNGFYFQLIECKSNAFFSPNCCRSMRFLPQKWLRRHTKVLMT